MTRHYVNVLVGVFLIALVLVVLVSPLYFLAPLVPLALVGFLVLYRYPQLGVLGLVFLVPLEGLFAGNKLFTGSKLIGVAMIAIVGMRLLFRHTAADTLKSSQWYAICGLVAVFMLSTLFSPYIDVSLDMTTNLLTGIVLFVITLATQDRLDPRQIMMALAVSVASTAALSLVSPEATTEGRAMGLLTDPNYFALLLVTAIPCTLYLLLYSKQLPLRLFWLALLALDLIALQKTLSRSGFLVLVLALGYLGWHYRAYLRKLQARQVGLVLATGLAGLIFLAAVMPADYVERITSLVNFSGVKSFEDRSLGRRASYFVVATNMVKDNPLFGAGPGIFPVHYAQSGYASAFSAGMAEPELFRRAHNTYLELLAEVGIVGCAFFTWLVLVGFWQLHQARGLALRQRDLAHANLIAHLGAAYLAVALFLFFLSATQHKYLWTMLALAQIALLPYLNKAAPSPSADAPSAPRNSP